MSLVENIKQAFSIKELRDKILYTLLLLFVYRVGTVITLPGIDPSQLDSLSDRAGEGILGLLNSFTGGAFAKASIMALGIMPYISASIVVQLMGIAVPYIQKLQKDGESGRKKINQITRWLTIAICLVQAPSYITAIKFSFGLPESAFLISDTFFWPVSIIILVAGTIFAMWLGEKITDNGIGNGVSLLITVGIIATLPVAFVQEYVTKTTGQGGGGLFILLIEVAVWLVVIMLSVMLTYAIRKVPLQYARVSQDGRRQVVNNRDYIPLKLNASGVMPIIFAQALMFIPQVVIPQSTENETLVSIKQAFGDLNSLPYNIVFGLLIILFTFFYTAITVQTNQMAEDFKRNNAFIPKVKPGEETENYIDDIMSKITLPGAIFLAMIAVLPAVAFYFGVTQGFALFFGGTSLLIMVGVAIDTVQQINSYLLNSRYDDLIKSGNINRSR